MFIIIHDNYVYPHYYLLVPPGVCGWTHVSPFPERFLLPKVDSDFLLSMSESLVSGTRKVRHRDPTISQTLYFFHFLPVTPTSYLPFSISYRVPP